MKNLQSLFIPFGLVFAFAVSPAAAQPKVEAKKPVVTLETSLGAIVLELDAEKAPVTVANFLAYVEDGFFDGTVFHRVIPDFMIQGGGFAANMSQKPTKAPIKNEADNGLENDSYTVAMARTAVKDSATAQFFINLKDNDFLNHGGRDFGYAVFGKVTGGVDVVKKIAGVATTTKGGHQNVPVEPVLIKSARRN
jgi:peptidyl-prolyl cis-trans isomerase A (cyclophilin A)